MVVNARPIKLDAAELERLSAGLTIMALAALGDADAAKDVVQESLARCLEALQQDRLADRTKIGAFVYGIARHVIADLHRGRRRTSSLDARHEAAQDTRLDDPLSQLITQEERERVRAIFAGLSEQDRDILHLSFFEGLSPAAIAERTGASSEVIWKRKSRALARLRHAYLARHDAGQESDPSATDIDRARDD